MSTNQRWIISTPRSSQNFTISFVDFRLSIRFLPPSIRGAATARGTLPTQHHRHVPLRLEPKPLVEAVLVLREQEETRKPTATRARSSVISIGIGLRGVFVGCGKAEQYPPGRTAVNTVRVRPRLYCSHETPAPDAHVPDPRPHG